MISLGWRRLAVCFVACGLWLGIQAASDDAASESHAPVELTQKRLDNMQFFGRLGKRMDSSVYEDNEEAEEKRLDPSMFGRLGKRDSEGENRDLEDSALFNRLAEEQDLLRKRFDANAYFGRLGKRDMDKRYDSRMFFGKLGKRNSERQRISRQLAELAKRGLDSMAYYGRLGKRALDYNQFYGRLG